MLICKYKLLSLLLQVVMSIITRIGFKINPSYSDLQMIISYFLKQIIESP